MTFEQAQFLLAHLVSVDAAIWSLVAINALGVGWRIVSDSARARTAERLVALRGTTWAKEYGVRIPGHENLARSDQNATPLRTLHSER
jgi:hypothetical protein